MRPRHDAACRYVGLLPHPAARIVGGSIEISRRGVTTKTAARDAPHSWSTDCHDPQDPMASLTAISIYWQVAEPAIIIRHGGRSLQGSGVRDL